MHDVLNLLAAAVVFAGALALSPRRRRPEMLRLERTRNPWPSAPSVSRDDPRPFDRERD